MSAPSCDINNSICRNCDLNWSILGLSVVQTECTILALAP